MANEKDKTAGQKPVVAEPLKPPEQRISEAHADEAAYAALGQIREILFGSIQRELERRLGRADAQLVARAHSLEQETRRRLDVLETHLRRETEALATRLDREVSTTTDALRQLAREHRDALTAIEQKVAKIEDAGAQGQRELRHQLLDQAKSFIDETQRLRAELFGTLQRELELEEGGLQEELGDSDRQLRH
jgi:hypothetical protein